MHTLYCIYKDGKPIDSNQANLKRNAFDRKGSAKSIITTLIHDEHTRQLRKIYGSDYYYKSTQEEKDQIEQEIRSHYEIKEYVLRT